MSRHWLSGAAALGCAVAVLAVAPRPASAATPAPVRNPHLTGRTSHTLGLAWTNPTSSSFAAVVVRVARGATAPASVGGGSAVATVAAPHHSVTAGRLAPGTEYSFALFASDGHGH